MNNLLCLIALMLGQSPELPDYMLLPAPTVVGQSSELPDYMLLPAPAVVASADAWHQIAKLDWYPSIWVWGLVSPDGTISWDPEAQADAWAKDGQVAPVWVAKDSRGIQWEHYDARVLRQFIGDRNAQYRAAHSYVPAPQPLIYAANWGGTYGTAPVVPCTTSA